MSQPNKTRKTDHERCVKFVRKAGLEYDETYHSASNRYHVSLNDANGKTVTFEFRPITGECTYFVVENTEEPDNAVAT